MSEKEVDEFFAALGFKKHKQHVEFPYRLKNLYQRRIEATPCKTNDRTHINATHTLFDTVISHDSVEFDITGESEDGRWFRLICYSIGSEELTNELVADITKRLTNAWEAAIKV